MKHIELILVLMLLSTTFALLDWERVQEWVLSVVAILLFLISKDPMALVEKLTPWIVRGFQWFAWVRFVIGFPVFFARELWPHRKELGKDFGELFKHAYVLAINVVALVYWVPVVLFRKMRTALVLYRGGKHEQAELL